MRKSMMIAAGLGMVLALAATRAWADAGGGKSGEATIPPATSEAAAATKPSPKQATDARIARLIEQLGSDKFAEREAAAKALIEMGEPALEALKVSWSSDFRPGQIPNNLGVLTAQKHAVSYGLTESNEAQEAYHCPISLCQTSRCLSRSCGSSFALRRHLAANSRLPASNPRLRRLSMPASNGLPAARRMRMGFFGAPEVTMFLSQPSKVVSSGCHCGMMIRQVVIVCAARDFFRGPLERTGR